MLENQASVQEKRDETSLWTEFAHVRTPELREQLFELHVNYAKAIAARLYRGRTRGDVEFADFYQLACVGLLESIERYQPLGNASFRTFCTRRIEGNILDGVEKLTEIQQQIAFHRRFRRDRLKSLKSAAKPQGTSQALAQLADVAVGLAIGFMLEETGMYAGIDDNQAVPGSPYETAAWSQARARLLECVSTLPSSERKVIEYHYLCALAFNQIADLLELTPGRISQIHHNALQLLRKNAMGNAAMWFTR